MCEELKVVGGGEYEVCQEIGRGRFGRVFRCIHPPSNNHSLACKVIDKRLLRDEMDRQCLQKEAKYMALLAPHPHILRIYDVLEEEQSLSLVVELCEPLTLLHRILRRPLRETEAAPLMKHLLEALAHCHRLRIAHRDVKPDNILFDSEGRLKLADFGSAEWMGEEEGMSGVVGTPLYVAPEVLLGRQYGEKVDVWSSGVVLYMMLCGMPPFFGDSPQDIFQAVLRANLRFPSPLFSSVSSSAKDLMRKMMCRDPSRRLSAQQALRHPWILRAADSTHLT